ncbi:MAG: YdgA family protein, partial [Neisseria sp.]|nr:YdgA family protein [Neisseria sp.]
MKKKFFAASAVSAAAAAAVLLAAPYYLGGKAEEVLNEQHALLKESSLVSIESRQYERGWFSSTETTVLRFNPALLNNAQRFLPDNIKTVLKEPVTVVNHISHGPLADFVPAAAKVRSEFRYQPETEKVLQRFFGSQAPLELSNTISFDGSGKLDFAVPAFKYQELSGIEINWQGLNGQTAYGRGWAEYKHNYAAPALHVKLADKGNISAENISFAGDTKNGTQNIALGSSQTRVGKFSLQWKEGIDYNFKLNELVQLVTDLQIGAFINPTGTVPPSEISVENLKFDTKVGESGEWINSEGRFGFDKLAYGKDVYGPLDIDVAAEHLDAAGLNALKQKMAEISSKEMSETEIQDALLHTAKNEAVSLFTSNPQIHIRRFDFTMPQGKVHADGTLAFNGLQAADLNDIGKMLKKTDAALNLNVPQKLLESLALSQARSIFTVNAEDEAAGEASIDDINETLRLMVDSTVKSMQGQGYLTLDNGDIATRIEVKQGELKLNGKVFEQEPEPEFTDADFAAEE